MNTVAVERPPFFSFRKIFIDSVLFSCQNVFCCFNVRRYLSWIEGLTTNQYVGGSNPSRRTTKQLFLSLDIFCGLGSNVRVFIGNEKGTYLKVRKQKPHSM